MPNGRKKIEEACADVQGLFTHSREAFQRRRSAKETESLLYYRGHQVKQDRLASPDELLDENPRIHNVIRPIVRASVSTAMRQKPNIQIASSKSDHSSRAKAKATEILAQSFMHNGTFNMEAWLRATVHAKICGLGWVKTFWNPDGGMPYIPDLDDQLTELQEMEVDDFGHPILEEEFPGEIEQVFVSSFDGYPDPAARSFAEMRHMFHVRLLPKTQLEDMFQEDYLGKKASFGRDAMENELQREYRSSQMDSGWEGVDEEELCELVDFWEKPTRKYPNGRFILMSGSTKLYVGPNPFWPRRLPFTPVYGDNIVPGSLYPDGVVRDLISPQGDINFAKTKTFEWIDKNINEPILAPFTSGIDEDQFTNRPGVIQYNIGNKPDRLSANDIPATVFNYAADQVEGANLISGYGDITRGNQPQADLSGRAMAYMRENEESARAQVLMRMRQSFLHGIQECVYLSRQFWDDGRYVLVMGENKSFMKQEFKADDYDFDNDLVPEVFSGRPQSPAMRMSEALELLSSGAMGDTPEADRTRHMLASDYDGLSTFDKNQLDREKAERHILEIKNNPYARVVAAEFDENEVHMAVINDFRKTVEYENLPDPQRQAIDALHDEHDAWLEFKEQELMQRQMMMQGGGQAPPPAPAAAPPGMPSPFDGGHSMLPDAQPSIEQDMAQAEIDPQFVPGT
ncbi:MAG: hypothetical protein ACRBI6_04720 [Acidimicrobiales bacterium]